MTIFELEQVRDALRDLVRLIEKEQQRIYYTDFTDTILSETEGDANRQAGEKNRGPRQRGGQRGFQQIFKRGAAELKPDPLRAPDGRLHCR